MPSPSKRPSHRLQEAFERQVLRGLTAEWQTARAMLPDTLTSTIRPPLFTIREMGRRLGSWNPDKREIALSRKLVNGHRWDDVREVLLHEMAHQVAHEGLGATWQTAHGDAFRQACGYLRANPAASGTYLPLRARLDRDDELNGHDRIVVKIHKLMALAESSNPNEAHAAMRKAHELIDRHQIEPTGRAVKQAYTSIFLGVPRLRHFREAYHLAHLLQDYYFVQGVWTPAWVLAKGKMGRVLEISGTPANVLVAEYVYEAVRRYIDASWRDYRAGKALNRYRQTDFAVGVVQGFRGTLQRTSTAAGGGNRLPVSVTDQALNRYVARRYPHLSTFSRSGPRHDAGIVADGHATGRRLVIARGISGADGSGGKLLPEGRQQ